MAQLPAGDVPLIPRWLRGLWSKPAAIDDATWQAVRRDCAWVAALDAPREQRLRTLASEFLHRKTISPLGGLQLDARQCGLLAALCCLPLLEYGSEGLRGWSQLLVYPDAFRVQRSHVDATGVLHEWEDELIGESWDSGPLVITWRSPSSAAGTVGSGAGIPSAAATRAHSSVSMFARLCSWRSRIVLS